MWTVRGLDDQANILLRLDDNDAISIVPVFQRFVRRLARIHPCHIRSKLVTPLRYHDGVGDCFVLLLPLNWHTTFRVIPNCEATDGCVELIHTGPLVVPI